MWCLAAEETPLWIQSHWGTHHIGHKHTKVHTSFLLCDRSTLPKPPPHSLTQFLDTELACMK